MVPVAVGGLGSCRFTGLESVKITVSFVSSILSLTTGTVTNLEAVSPRAKLRVPVAVVKSPGAEAVPAVTAYSTVASIAGAPPIPISNTRVSALSLAVTSATVRVGIVSSSITLTIADTGVPRPYCPAPAARSVTVTAPLSSGVPSLTMATG